MKTISLSLLLTGLLMPIACPAQPIDKPEPPPVVKKGQRNIRSFDEIWKATDKNADGYITAEELASLPRMQRIAPEKQLKIFARLDQDADGKLNRKELQGLVRQAENFPTKRLWELDTDGNSSISLEEFKSGPITEKLSVEKQEELFKKLDTNGDGGITKNDKILGKPTPTPRPDGPQPKLDANKDSALSFEEFRQGPRMKKLGEDQQEASFEAIDTNGDLKITIEDFTPSNPPPVDKPAQK